MIKSIIFDLGQVILDCDWKKTVQAFADLGIDIEPLVFSADFWEQLGKNDTYSPESFSDLIRKRSGSRLSNHDIVSAWNRQLCPFTPARMTLLERFTQNYHLYLLSNTDEILIEAFESQCLKQFGKPLSSYFTATYYSSRIGLRKPDPQIFQEFLHLSALTANECLFIDDKIENVTAAKAMGFKTIHLTGDLLDVNFEKVLK